MGLEISCDKCREQIKNNEKWYRVQVEGHKKTEDGDENILDSIKVYCEKCYKNNGSNLPKKQLTPKQKLIEDIKKLDYTEEDENKIINLINKHIKEQ